MNDLLEDDDLRLVDVLLVEELAPARRSAAPAAVRAPVPAPPRQRWLAVAAGLLGIAAVCAT